MINSSNSTDMVYSKRKMTKGNKFLNFIYKHIQLQTNEDNSNKINTTEKVDCHQNTIAYKIWNYHIYRLLYII